MAHVTVAIGIFFLMFDGLVIWAKWMLSKQNVVLTPQDAPPQTKSLKYFSFFMVMMEYTVFTIGFFSFLDQALKMLCGFWMIYVALRAICDEMGFKLPFNLYVTKTISLYLIICLILFI